MTWHGMRDRFDYWRTVFLQLVWPWFVSIPVGLLGALQAVRDEFPDARWLQLVRLDQWLPRWPLEWWAIGFLVLLILGVLEGAYRLGDPRSKVTENAATAFQIIYSQSQWAWRSAKQWEKLPADLYETSKSKAQVTEDRLHHALDKEIHNALRRGDIVAVGCGGATNTQRTIAKEEWDGIALDFSQKTLSSKTLNGGPPNVCAWRMTEDPRAGSRIVYTQVCFLGRELYRQFPLAWRARKRLDS